MDRGVKKAIDVLIAAPAPDGHTTSHTTSHTTPHDTRMQPAMNLAHANLHMPQQQQQEHQLHTPQDQDDSTYLGNPEEDEDGDYFELFSDDSSTTDMLRITTWAAFQKDKKRFRKGKGKGGGKGKGKGKSRDPDEVPQGWTKEKWLARTKCATCGSRWHRDCSKPKGKGKGKSQKAHWIPEENNLADGIVWMLGEPTAPDPPPPHTTARAPRRRFGIVVDTGATSNVTGSQWVEAFVEEVLQPQDLHDQVLTLTNFQNYRHWKQHRDLGDQGQDPDRHACRYSDAGNAYH